MLAVVGHVEWVEFAHVDHVPAAGDVAHAHDMFSVPAGGGAAAAVELARLAGEAQLFTALGDDELGHRSAELLSARGVHVHAAWREQPTRRALTLVDPQGERTITTLGERLEPRGDDPLPWEELEEGVYFTAGDGAALRRARAGARVLVASPRAHAALRAAPVELDALVFSARDPLERAAAATIPARLLLSTEGAAGGEYRRDGAETGRWAAAPLPGPPADSYGCGDTFAAAVTFGLARGDSLEETLAQAARAAAACLTRRGPYPASRAAT